MEPPRLFTGKKTTMRIRNHLYFEKQKRWEKKPDVNLSLVFSSRRTIRTLMIVRSGFFLIFCNILHIVRNVKMKQDVLAA